MNNSKTSGDDLKEADDRYIEVEKILPMNEDTKKDAEIKITAVTFFQLYKFATKWDILLATFGLLASFLNGGSMAAYSIMIGGIFDQLNSPEGFQEIASIELCGLGLAVITVGTLQVLMLTISADRIVARVREEYLHSLLKQDVAFFDSHKLGELSTAIVENSMVFREAIGDKLGQFIQSITMFLAGLGVGLYYGWALALVTLSLSPILAVCGFFMARNSKLLVAKQLNAYSKAGGIAEETLSNVRTITSLGAQEHRIHMFAQELEIAAKSAYAAGKLSGLGNGMTMGTFFISYGIAMYAGGTFIAMSRTAAEQAYPLTAMGNQTFPFCQVGGIVPPACALGTNSIFETPADVCGCALCGCGCNPNPAIFGPDANYKCFSGGDVFTVFFGILLGSFGLGQAGPAISAVTNGRVAAKKIYDLIDQEPGVSAQGETKIAQPKGEIVLKNVMFRYPTRPDVQIFQSLNLTIPPGQRVGLVGESGSGKSTITQLILRFYDPDSGAIYFDGQDLKTFDMKWYRSMIGLISQEPILFATTIMENVRFGKPGATDQEVEQACKAANAHEFIMTFPEKYNTFVGAGGSQISGGEKQRICLARAFIRKPTLFIADEATSALDTASEAIVNNSIDNFGKMNGQACTTIVIAHRLDTIRKCDRIVFLDHGKVVEEGTHDQLVARPNGSYAALFRIAEAKPKEREEASTPHESDENKAIIEVEAEDNKEEDEEDSVDATVITQPFQDHSKMVAQIEDDSTLGKHAKGDASSGKKKKKKTKKEKQVPASRAFKFAYEDRYVFIPAIFGSAVSGVIFPVFALVLSNILTTFYLPVEKDLLAQCGVWALAFLGLGVAQFLAAITQGTAFGFINGRMTARVREETFRGILRCEMGFFDDPKNAVGVLTSKLASDASLVKASISDRSSVTVQNIATLSSGLTIAFTASWKMSLVVFGTFPFTVLGGIIQMRAMQGVMSNTQNELADANQTVAESVAGIRTVVAFEMQTPIENVYRSQLAKSRKGVFRKSLAAGFGFGFSQSTRFFIYALALWYGSTLLESGEIQFKDMNQAMFGILMSAIALGQAVALAPDLSQGRVAVQSIFRILDRKSPIDWSNKAGSKPSTLLGDISFENVTFSYPTRPGQFALKNFSIKIPRGKTIALVGPSGSGKSTTVSLLERFYDADKGVVKVDDYDITSLNIEWLRSQIGLVSQEPVLMNETILANIRYGHPGATDEECIQASKDANAHDFIMRFPHGYNTLCGNKGGQMSGGQKQRISIARCLVRQPKILLLDESTSALDEESQKVVQEALDRLLKAQSRTTLIIAHRFSTIKNADIIFVVDHGVLVEQGTFNELAAKNGAFSALLRAQGGA